MPVYAALGGVCRIVHYKLRVGDGGVEMHTMPVDTLCVFHTPGAFCWPHVRAFCQQPRPRPRPRPHLQGDIYLGQAAIQRMLQQRTGTPASDKPWRPSNPSARA